MISKNSLMVISFSASVVSGRSRPAGSTYGVLEVTFCTSGKQCSADFSESGSTVTQETAFSDYRIRCEPLPILVHFRGPSPRRQPCLAQTLERLPARGLRVLALVAISLAVITTQASATTSQKHFFWAPGQAPNPSSVANDLIYHGG